MDPPVPPNDQQPPDAGSNNDDSDDGSADVGDGSRIARIILEQLLQMDVEVDLPLGLVPDTGTAIKSCL